jgi:hypothetical protein
MNNITIINYILKLPISFVGKIRKSPIIGIMVAVLFYAACGRIDKFSDSDRQKFVNIYIELSLAYWKSQSAPDNYQSLATAIFNKYDVDRTFMIKIQKRFENNPKRQLAIYQEIVERLKGYEDISQDSLKQVLDKTIDTR